MAVTKQTPLIGAVILAAGRGTRFSSGNKLNAPFGGGTVLSAVITAVLGSKVKDIVLVTSDLELLVPSPKDRRLRRTTPNATSRGLAQSLKAGILALNPDAEAAMIVLGDMPLVTADLIDVLIASFNANGRTKIVFPENAQGEQGHPVIWPRLFFGELFSLEGDRGGKDIIAANVQHAAPVLVQSAGPFTDVDTRASYERLLKTGRT